MRLRFSVDAIATTHVFLMHPQMIEDILSSLKIHTQARTCPLVNEGLFPKFQ